MSEFRPVRLSDEQRIDWLRLIRTENVGPRTFRTLINQFGGAKRAIEHLPDLARRGGRGALKVVSREDAAREISAATRLGVQFAGLGEIEYPALLRETDDAPPASRGARRNRNACKTLHRDGRLAQRFDGGAALRGIARSRSG